MPLGMIELFKGQFGWKMPPDVQIAVGPSHIGGNLPQTWVGRPRSMGHRRRSRFWRMVTTCSGTITVVPHSLTQAAQTKAGRS
jgi:hypothetical protein